MEDPRVEAQPTPKVRSDARVCRAPKTSIQRKSALRLRKEPSSSALQYFTRKNMWNTKSSPARSPCGGLFPSCWWKTRHETRYEAEDLERRDSMTEKSHSRSQPGDQVSASENTDGEEPSTRCGE